MASCVPIGIAWYCGKMYSRHLFAYDGLFCPPLPWSLFFPGDIKGDRDQTTSESLETSYRSAE